MLSYRDWEDVNFIANGQEITKQYSQFFPFKSYYQNLPHNKSIHAAELLAVQPKITYTETTLI